MSFSCHAPPGKYRIHRTECHNLAVTTRISLLTSLLFIYGVSQTGYRSQSLLHTYCIKLLRMISMGLLECRQQNELNVGIKHPCSTSSSGLHSALHHSLIRYLVAMHTHSFIPPFLFWELVQQEVGVPHYLSPSLLLSGRHCDPSHIVLI